MDTINEDIVIIGAGIAGLTTSLALHRLGIRSLVLESADKLKFTGFGLTLMTNAWRGLDVLGVASDLRKKFPKIESFQVASLISGLPSHSLIKADERSDWEIRCVLWKELLESLERELPRNTIRYSSAVVSIEDQGYQKAVHLADGTIIKAKVLVGCDGVNSVVAKCLGLKKPIETGKSAVRGYVEYPEGHGIEPRLHEFFGGGVRYGFLPCDDKGLYWFCMFDSCFERDEDMKENPLKLKQFILSKLGNISKVASDVVAKTKLDAFWCSTLKLRVPWSLLYQNISKNNVCVAGDAFHPMTPDLGQGGCSSIEDGIVLARCLGQVFCKKSKDEKEEFERIKKGLEKYAKERRWRSISLITIAYVVGFIQERGGESINFLRNFGTKHMANAVMWMANFHCGELIES